MHADVALTINNGEIEITRCYEGLESAVITIQTGTIRIHASDDAINVAGGNDSSGMNPGFKPGGRGGGGPGQDAFAESGNYFLYIHGGYLALTAGGDGLDINGSIEMTGGTVLVNGPTENMNGAVDYDRSYTITGGVLVATGSAGMAMAPGETSSQYSVPVNFSTPLEAGTEVHIQDGAGKNILTFVPTKTFQSLAFSSPALTFGETYTVILGGDTDGAGQDGWYPEAEYTPGSVYTTFTISGIVTRIGAGSGPNSPR